MENLYHHQNDCDNTPELLKHVVYHPMILFYHPWCEKKTGGDDSNHENRSNQIKSFSMGFDEQNFFDEVDPCQIHHAQVTIKDWQQ